MTAAGFLMLVASVWIVIAIDKPSRVASLLAIMGVSLLIAGITQFLWESMP